MQLVAGSTPMPLSDLIAALESATGPSREMDERIATEVFGWRMDIGGNAASPPGFNYFLPNMPPAYTSSLDAITGALEQRWLGINWRVDNSDAYECPRGWARLWPRGRPGSIDETAASSALALCLAAVRLAEREAAYQHEGGQSLTIKDCTFEGPA